MKNMTPSIYNKIITGLLLTLFLSLALSPISGQAQESDLPSSTSEQPTTIGLYELFEVSFQVPEEYDNPYDPTQITVTGTFTSPTETTIGVPAFYMQRYEQVCEQGCLSEELEPRGNGEWRIRFTPTRLGEWSYDIRAVTQTDQRFVIDSGRFEVVESGKPGFISIPRNSQYFVFDDGSAYFPVGQNLAWSWEDGGGIFAYIDWLDELQAAGANYARLFIDIPWFIGLEWEVPAGQYGGTGQEAAWRLDTIVEAAEKRGIYLQLVLIWHQAFREYTGTPVNVPPTPDRADTSADFDNNPYNVVRAGTLQNPGGVFIDPVSQSLLEQRLRYIVARWGYSPHVFAWEVVDRFDRMENFEAERGNEWLNPLIEVIRQADIYNHPITVGLYDYQPLILANSQLDFVQVSVYQSRPVEQADDQIAEVLEALNQARLVAPDRPVLLNEFSLNPWFEPTADDPTGVHLRNTIWATALYGAAGSAMSWWWDTYVDAQDLYSIHTPLALFTRDIPWHTTELASVTPRITGDFPYENLRIEDFNRQFRSSSPEDVIYRLAPEGASPPISQMSSYLYGRTFNSENSRPQTFLISPPVDTTLTIRIGSVSTAASAQLSVTVDGEPFTTVDLDAGTRGLSIRVPLEAGEHTVVIDNLGEDWLELEYLEIENYRPPLQALALADSQEGILLAWIHHREYTWSNILEDNMPSALEGRLALSGMPPGTYQVEFWDTVTGNVIGEEQVMLDDEDDSLSINLLPVESQLAIRAFRLTEG